MQKSGRESMLLVSLLLYSFFHKDGNLYLKQFRVDLITLNARIHSFFSSEVCQFWIFIESPFNLNKTVSLFLERSSLETFVFLCSHFFRVCMLI